MPKPVKPPPGRNVPTPVPSRGDRQNFASRGDATMTAMPGVVDDMNTNVDYVDQALDYVDAQLDGLGEVVEEVEDLRDQAGLARDQSQAFALSAVNAPGTSGTSASTLTLSPGVKTLTTQPGKAWMVGQNVVVSRGAAPGAMQMAGPITAYNGGTGLFSFEPPVGGVKGSGTFSDWVIALTGLRGPSGVLPDVLHVESGAAVKGARNLIGAAGITLTLPASWSADEAIEFGEVIGEGAQYTLNFGTTRLRGRLVGSQSLTAAFGASGVLRFYDATRGLA